MTYGWATDARTSQERGTTRRLSHFSPRPTPQAFSLTFPALFHSSGWFLGTRPVAALSRGGILHRDRGSHSRSNAVGPLFFCAFPLTNLPAPTPFFPARG